MHLVDRDDGHMVVERIERGRCRTTCPDIACVSSTTASAPVEGTAMDSDSETTGIRLLTSTLVTSVRWASAMACAGSAA